MQQPQDNKPSLAVSVPLHLCRSCALCFYIHALMNMHSYISCEVTEVKSEQQPQMKKHVISTQIQQGLVSFINIGNDQRVLITSMQYHAESRLTWLCMLL